MINDFRVAGGSIIGTEHVRTGKNNHDDFFWDKNEKILIGLACDGCGSGKHSEVGSKIGSRLIANSFLHLCKPEAAVPWERIRHDVIAQIQILTTAMGGSFSQTINDYFLFTVVGALITSQASYLFSIGDGFIAVNGEIIRVGPFANNTPPYLAYELVSSSIDRDLLKFHVHKTIGTEEVQSILIGTDGVFDLENSEEKKIPGKEDLVGHISQFWQDKRYYNNPDMIRRSLSLINRCVTRIPRGEDSSLKIQHENGLLPDDTTIVAIRRIPLNHDTEKGD